MTKTLLGVELSEVAYNSYENIVSASKGLDYQFELIDGNIYYCLLLDDIYVSNRSKKNFTVLKNMIIFIPFSAVNGKIGSFLGTRLSFSIKEYHNGYKFSHIRNNCKAELNNLMNLFSSKKVLNLNDIYRYANSFCIGSSSAKIEEIRGEYNDTLTEINFIKFIFQLKTYLSYESLEGGPFKAWHTLYEIGGYYGIRSDNMLGRISPWSNITGSSSLLLSDISTFFNFIEPLQIFLRELDFNFKDRVYIKRDKDIDIKIYNCFKQLYHANYENNAYLKRFILLNRVYKDINGNYFTQQIFHNLRQQDLISINGICSKIENTYLEAFNKKIYPSIDNKGELKVVLSPKLKDLIEVFKPIITNQIILSVERKINHMLITNEHYNSIKTLCETASTTNS